MTHAEQEMQFNLQCKIEMATGAEKVKVKRCDNEHRTSCHNQQVLTT
jgi:translation initiation factor IF-1